MKHISILVISLLLTGCGFMNKTPEEPQVKIVKEEVEIAIYQPPSPSAVKLESVTWVVITKANLQEKIAEIEKKTGGAFVIFAITPRDYENLAHNVQDLKRYIREQRAIIRYYESVTKTSETWIEKNDKKRAEQKKQFEAENLLDPKP